MKGFLEFIQSLCGPIFREAMAGDGISIVMAVLLVIVGGMCLLVVGYLGWLLVASIGEALAEDQTCDAVIIGRHYTPAHAITGVGTGIGANGSVTSVVTTTYTPEAFDLEFQVKGGPFDGLTDMLGIDGSHFGRYLEGDDVRLTYRVPKFVGGISWRGIEYMNSAHRLGRRRKVIRRATAA